VVAAAIGSSMPQACRSKESSEDGGAEKGPSGAGWVTGGTAIGPVRAAAKSGGSMTIADEAGVGRITGGAMGVMTGAVVLARSGIASGADPAAASGGSIP
jgi:hypothetical protein